MSAGQLEEPFMPFNLAAAPAVKPTAHKLFLPLPADNPRRTPPAALIPLSAAELPAMPLGSHQESIDAAERCISYSKLLMYEYARMPASTKRQLVNLRPSGAYVSGFQSL